MSGKHGNGKKERHRAREYTTTLNTTKSVCIWDLWGQENVDDADIYLKIFARCSEDDLVGLDEPALGGESDVQHGVGGKQSGEPGHQVPGVI